MSPADTLRALRARAGHTQLVAGLAVGVARRTWENYEAGVRKVPPAVVHLYALQVARPDDELVRSSGDAVTAALK